MNIVYRSGSELATAAAPMLVPAPGLFSITTCSPQILDSRSAVMRATVSVRSAGRIRDDDAHGAGGPGLGKRGTVDSGRKRKCRGNEATTVDDDCCLQSTFPRRTVTEAVGRSREQ